MKKVSFGDKSDIIGDLLSFLYRFNLSKTELIPKMFSCRPQDIARVSVEEQGQRHEIAQKWWDDYKRGIKATLKAYVTLCTTSAIPDVQLQRLRQNALEILKEEVHTIATQIIAVARLLKDRTLWGGFPCALYCVGLLEEKPADAFEWYKMAIDAGCADAGAQFALGSCYKCGCGVRRNEQEALRLFIEAADKGHVEAQLDAGMLLDAQFRYAEALTWFAEAAAHGDPYAQGQLAVCYKNGKGVEKNQERAEFWDEQSREGMRAGKGAARFHRLKALFGQEV